MKAVAVGRADLHESNVDPLLRAAEEERDLAQEDWHEVTRGVDVGPQVSTNKERAVTDATFQARAAGIDVDGWTFDVQVARLNILQILRNSNVSKSLEQDSWGAAAMTHEDARRRVLCTVIDQKCARLQSCLTPKPGALVRTKQRYEQKCETQSERS